MRSLSATWIPSPTVLKIFFGAVIAHCLTIAHAQVIENIVSFVRTDTGYIIESDFSNRDADWDRDGMHLRTVVSSFNPTGGAQGTSYTVVYRVLNSLSQPHPIYEASGNTNASYTYFAVVNAFAVPAHVAVVRTNLAFIRPAAPLNPYENYTLEVQIFKPGNGTPVDTATLAGQRFYHFTSVTSDDLRLNVILTTDDVTFSKPSAVRTDPQNRAFEANVVFTLRRYDNFEGSHLPQDEVPTRISWTLRNAATQAAVPLTENSTNFTVLAYRYDPPPPNDPIAPYVIQLQRTIYIRPADGVQLDSVDDTFELTAHVSHKEFPNLVLYAAANQETTPATRLLHFNGTLLFGAVETQFTSIDNSPPVLSVVAGSHVNTRLGVDQQSGFILGNPAWTYGDGTDLLVRLLSNGDAELSLGAVPLNIPNDPTKVANVRFDYEQPLLRQSGLWADLRVYLPTGLGYRTDLLARYIRPTILIEDVSLGQNLLPVLAQLVFAPAGGIFVADETKPIWMPASSITWDVADGEFTVQTSGTPSHVRKKEYAELAAYTAELVQPAQALKRSNDRVYDFVNSIGPTVTVEPDANCAAQVSMEIGFISGDFRTHFPWDTLIAWTGNGALRVARDIVDSSASQLSSVSSVGVIYARGCLGDDCPGGANAVTPTMVPTANELRFTRDGGLAAHGPLFLFSPNRVQWGYVPSANDYAHESFTFTDAGFHMPGHFLRGDQTGLDLHHDAGVLLFSGVLAADPGEANTLERRDLDGSANQTRYLAGLADYAGLNYRVAGDGAIRAESLLAGTPTGAYELKANSKYYVRFGGVSGVHDPVAGSFPEELTLAGYQFQFDHFAFNLLDSHIQRSYIDGQIELPFPSDFVQEFASLRFNCRGGLLDAQMPSAATVKLMAYWNADIHPQAIEFVTPDVCDPGRSLLVLGVNAWASHVTEPLHGRLGYLTNGNLASLADGWPGIDSRLSMPSTIHLAGPSNEVYSLAPVTAAYYNDYRAATGEAFGWVNFAAKTDVPFFEDLMIHAHTGAQQDDETSLVHLMGGWPSESGDPHKGWEDNENQHFFNYALFDPANRGYPKQVTVASYRDMLDDQYRVRAQRRWQKVVRFDYPLRWFNASRIFRSFEPKENNYWVLSTHGETKHLTPHHADLVVGTQFDILPHANFVNAFFFLAENTGITDAITDAIGVTDRDAIAEGLTAMDELLAARMEELIDRVMDEAFGKPDQGGDTLLNELYALVEDEYEAEFDIDNPTDWITNDGNFFVTTYQPKIKTALKEIADDLDKPILKVLGEYLGKFQSGINGVGKLIGKDGGGKRDKALKFVQKLFTNYAAEHQWFADNQVVEALLEDGEGSLNRIGETLSKLATVIGHIKDHMNNLGSLQDPGGLGVEIKDLLQDSDTELDQTAQAIAGGVQDFFMDVVYQTDSPFADYDELTIKTMIRQHIVDQFLDSPVAADIQSILRQRLYDNDAAAREAIDAIFQEINLILREILKATASELAGEFTDFLGDLQNSMASASIDGHAHIKDDSLTLLRIDLKAKVAMKDKLEFGAFVQIKELNSDGTKGCYNDYDSATEVSFGAQDVKLSWIGDGLKLNANAKFTFKGLQDEEGQESIGLIGVGGGFDITGSLKLATLELKRLAAAFAVGLEENYLSGFGQMKVQGWEVAGGAFFGKTCTLDPIKLWDPDVAGALGDPQPSFTGFYTYGEGWVPVNELIGIPSSCLFRLAGGFGFGCGMFIEGPIFVAKMKYGVSGDLLCLVSVKGELIGVATVDLKNLLEPGADGETSSDHGLPSVTVRGIGKLTGKLGFCPVCLKFSKQKGITFKDGKWKFD